MDFLPGLAEALHQSRTGAAAGNPDRECTMCITIRHTQPGESRDTLIACAAGRISGRALHKSLRQVGVNVSRESILNHRNERHQP